MSINKKIFASLTVLSIVSALAACSSGNLPSSVSVNTTTNFSSANQTDIKVAQLAKSMAPKGESVSIVDAGNGQQTGGTFAMKINYGDGKAFNTKGPSITGVARKTVAD